MIYINIAYVLTRITRVDLDAITGGVDAMLDEPELEAIEEVSSYLSWRYDTAAIFAPDQDEPDKIATMKRLVTDILIYNLHNRVNPRNIPEKRIGLRDDAIGWLKLVASPRSEVEADFLPLKTFADKTGTDISWNSQPKRNNSY